MLVGEVTGAEGTQGTLGTPVSLPGEIRATPPGSITSCPYPDESAVRETPIGNPKGLTTIRLPLTQAKSSP